MIVDAHRHYWDPSTLEYAWLDGAPAALRRAFLPADAPHDACLLVQAAPSEEETRFLFALARSQPDVVGVVGWVDMEATDVDARLDRLIDDGDGLLRGIRPMVQDIADVDWLVRPSLDRAFDALCERGLVFDALVDDRHLRVLSQRLARHPGLHTVIDHAAKPDIAARSFAAWAGAMARLAQMPDVYCKLSGLLTLTAPDADPADIEPYIAHLFESFGGRRLVWGSDWPVLTTHASYEAWKGCAWNLTRRYAPQHVLDVFGANALTLYSRADRRSTPDVARTSS